MKFYLRGRLSNGSKSCLTRHGHSPICVSIGSFERPLVMVGVSGKIWLKFSILSHSLRVDLINFFFLFFLVYILQFGIFAVLPNRYFRFILIFFLS